MSTKPTVVVRNLSKTYYLTKDGEERGLTPRNRRTSVEALKPTTFVAHSGESIGIIGRNGSGKSTLSALIAGHAEPTSGMVLVSAQPTLLSVSAALQPHLNALDNVKLGLLAKGMTPAEADEIKESVVRWADIGKASDRPLKTYSSGMGARLKFAIATAVRSEILLVDEALATGDASFNARAEQRMSSMLANASTIFLVTHSASTIRRQCNRTIWIDQGEIIADGAPRKITQLYQRWSDYTADNDRAKAMQLIRRMRRDYKPRTLLLGSEATAINNK